MGLPKKSNIIIDGVDVTSYLMEWEVLDRFDNNIMTANVGLKSTVTSVLDVNSNSIINKIITIKRGETTGSETIMFKGKVRTNRFKGGGVYLICEDMLSDAKYIVINESFHYDIDPEAGVFSDIFDTLITDNTSLTAQVVDSGTLNIVQQLILPNRFLFDALFELAYLADWQFYYNPRIDKVVFEPKGYTESTNVLRVGTEIINLPKWDVDSSQMFNNIKVIGAPQLVTKTEGSTILDGVADVDWTTTSLILSEKPVDVQIFCDTSNPPVTEKKGGATSSTSSFDFLVTPDLKKITWSSSFNPTTSYYAKILNTYNIPITVQRKNASSIAEFGETKQNIQRREDLKVIEDVEQWAFSQLNIYGFPFYKTTCKVKDVDDLRAGVIYVTQDVVQGVDRTLMVKEVKYNFPFRYDSIMIADKEFRTSNWGTNFATRVRKLEEKDTAQSELIRQVIDLDLQAKVRSRYFLFQRRDPHEFTLDHPTLGILDTSNLDPATDVNAYETKSLIQGNNNYLELFYDNDFKNTTNTTATWNTTNKNLVFSTDTEIAESEMIHYVQQNIQYVTFSVTGIDTSDATYYASADDGTTWQEITIGTKTLLTHTGQKLKWKIVNFGTEADTRITEDSDIRITEDSDTRITEATGNALTINTLNIKVEV